MNKNKNTVKIVESNGIILKVGSSWAILEAKVGRYINTLVPAWNFVAKADADKPTLPTRFGKNLVEAIDAGLELRFNIEPVEDSGEEEHKLVVEYDDAGETWVAWRNFRHPMSSAIYCGDIKQEVIKLTSGSYYIPMFGKYKPDLGFIIHESDAPEGVIDKLFTDSFVYNNKKYHCVYGKYFKSKKGTDMFEVSDNGPHVLIEDEWGGAFNSYRGLKDPQKAIYCRHKCSHGGGLGVNYFILPKDDTEDLVDLDDL